MMGTLSKLQLATTTCRESQNKCFTYATQDDKRNEAITIIVINSDDTGKC